MILGLAAIAALVFQQWLHSRLVKDLNTRLMSKSLQEFKYFTEIYKNDVKRQDKALDKAIEEEEKETEDTSAEGEAVTKFLQDVEEDFAESEVDIDKLKASMRGEDK